MNSFGQHELFKSYEMGLQGSCGLAFKNVRQIFLAKILSTQKRLSIFGKLFIRCLAFMALVVFG